MPSSKDPIADATPEEKRLAALLAEFERKRENDRSVGIESMRDEAGTLFPELTHLVECLGLLGDDPDAEGVEPAPAEIGRYRVLGRLGAGVSSVVYRAVDPEDDRPVAVKLMRESIALDGKALERFRREIRAARRLRHSHIVPLLDHGEVGGRLYQVQELVEGCSLADLLDEIELAGDRKPNPTWLEVLDAHGVARLDESGLLPAEEYARRMAALFEPLGGALQVAADAGLVHRDLKPANLLLRRDGRLLISDFGLAKIVDEEMTSVAAVLGTPAYMSPEQAGGRSREADSRSDIYGLGATLYAALTLEPPFRAESFPELVAAILSTEPPSVSAVCAEYPAGISRVVSRCLEKEPGDRYPDGATLGADLARVAAGRRPAAASLPLSRRARKFASRRRVPLAAAALLLVALVAGLLWLGRPAQIEIRSLPEGGIELDGEDLGATPFAGRVPSGTHELVVTRDRFKPHRETLELDAGAGRPIMVSLTPVDPFDRVALGEILLAHGVSAAVPEAEPARYRDLPPGPDAPWTEKVTVAAPRGRIGRDGVVVLLHLTEGIEGLQAVILEPGTGEPLIRALVAARAGLCRIPVPEEVRIRLVAGTQYTLRVGLTDDESAVESEFEVVEEEAPLLPGADPGRAHVRILTASHRLETGRAADALVLALGLAEEQPGRSLPLRIALAAMDRLKLGGGPLYQETYARYLETTDRED